MSLAVWLPLTGDLHNQGLTNISITNNGTTINNDGKIGKAIEFGTNKYIKLDNYASTFLTYNTWSLSLWFKCTAQNTSHTGSALISGGNWNQPTNLLILALGNFSSNKYTTLFVSGSGGWNKGYDYNFLLNQWYHVTLTSGNGKMRAYVNGQLIGDSYNAFKPTTLGQTWICIGNGTYSQNFHFYGLMNDVRIYDHCLSDKEVEEISKGLVLHYQLNNNGMGGENLFRGSAMSVADRAVLVSNSNTDWTKYLRMYNGSTSIHSFSGDIDTISLNSSGNLGICFQRKATDINLDSTSYYIISCEAKCNKTGAGLDIGLSYYDTSNNWVWRGGTNRQLFNNTTDWQKFTLKFKPDADTQYIMYCFTVVGKSGGTETFSIRHCKLEKGEKATPWSPSPLDSSYPENYKTTIYDTSGYSNNGTIVGNLTAAAPSPRYNVYTNLTTTSSHICTPALTTSGFTNSFSISWWGNVSSYSGRMMWGFSDGNHLNGIYNGNLWNTADGASNPIYTPGTTTQVSAPTINVWHHFVMTGDGSVNKIYKDGELWGQSKTYKSLTGTTIYFNGWENSTQYALANTKISDFRIYATALTAAQVTELYNQSIIVDASGNVLPRELVN